MSSRGIFERFFDEGLAQASFLVGCDRTKQVVVIDPRRDASVYLAAARQRGATIVAAIETHVHADFVSGACELARSGARVYTGPGADLAFDHHEVRDGEELAVGDVTLRFLHTPGHTFEHVAVLAETPAPGLSERRESRGTARLFTGDLLFVGGVGRPDLVGEAQTRQLASDLYDSLGRIMALGDEVEVHPGHGAGSLCGAGIGKDPSTTIARERAQNTMLQHADRASFVAAVLADIPPTPPYFSRMKRINKEGPPQVDPARKLPALRPAAAAALAADGALVIDLRTGAAFADAHPDGALNIGHGPKVGYWAGWVVPAEAPLILLADEAAHAQDAALQLYRIGLDRIEGTIAGGFEAWAAAGLPTARIEQISAAHLRDEVARGAGITIVDVRTPQEWQSGHVDGAINVPAGEVPARAAELPRDGTIATICEGGYRSSLAASLFAQEGFPHVTNVAGGMTAFRALK